MNFHAILSFSVLSSFSENERENGQFTIFLSFFRCFSKRNQGGKRGRRGYFSFDARGQNGHQRALGYCAKIVIYSNYLNKTACFRTKIIKYCLKNSTKKNAFSCVYFT